MNKKVYILTILVFVMAINAVFSQTTTKKLSYQAVVRNAANELVVNQSISVEITILNADNAPQYKETHTVTTNQNGLMWLWIGDGTPSQGTIDDVVWKDATILSSFTLPDGNTVTQNTPVTAMPYAYYADEVDPQVIQDYLNGHHYITDDNDYVENPQLNDKLSHYYTNEDIDDTLGHYVTTDKLNDTLGHYLMKEVQVLSISHDTIFLTGGSYVVLPKGFSGSYHDLVDTPTNVSAFTNDAGYLTEHQSLENYVTHGELNNTLNAYYDTTRMKTAIHDTANVLRGLMGDAANNATITIKKNDVEVDHFTLNQENDKAIDITVPTTVAELSDASNYVTNTKLSDTLNKYTTTNKVDTLLGAYYDTTHINQTLKQYLKTGDLCDSIVKCEVIKDMRDSIQDNAAAIDLNTHQIEANAAAISGLQTKLHNDSLTLANKIRTDSTALVNRIVSDSSALADKMQSDSSALAGKMYNDSLTLAHRMDTVYKHLCDSVMNCSGIQTMQSNIAKNATDISNVQTKMHEDSLTLANKIRTDSTALAGKMHNDSLTLANKIRTDSTALVNRIVNDSTILHDALIDTAHDIRSSIGNASLTIAISEGTTTPLLQIPKQTS